LVQSERDCIQLPPSEPRAPRHQLGRSASLSCPVPLFSDHERLRPEAETGLAKSAPDHDTACIQSFWSKLSCATPSSLLVIIAVPLAVGYNDCLLIGNEYYDRTVVVDKRLAPIIKPGLVGFLDHYHHHLIEQHRATT
jgi:hypothetical protein